RKRKERMMLTIIEQYFPIIMMIIPMVVMILFYQTNYWIYKHKWRAIHFTVQASSIFYVISVIYMLERWLPFMITRYIVIDIMLMISIILIRQWRKKKEVVLSKALKFMARILFLVCFILYLTLIVIEIVQFIS